MRLEPTPLFVGLDVHNDSIGVPLVDTRWSDTVVGVSQPPRANADVDKVGLTLTLATIGKRRQIHGDQRLVTRWVEEQATGRWRLTTCIQFASKLLSSAFSAGLVATNRDPRPLRLPMVDDLALTYLMYLLREVSFAGTLLENPYLASVGLRDDVLERRLKRLTALRFRRQADLTDFDWQFESLTHWAESTVCCPESVLLRGAS